MIRNRRKSYTVNPGIVWLRQKTATPEKMSEVIDDLCLVDKTLVPLSPTKIIQIEKDPSHPSVTFAEVQTYLFFNHQKIKTVNFKDDNPRKVSHMLAQQEYITKNNISRVELYYRTGLNVESVTLNIESSRDSKGIVAAAIELLDERIEALRQEHALFQEKKKDTP
jgi:hypothetical protein